MIHNTSLVFGCAKLEDGSYEQHAKGTVYWSKVWYADLGEDMCYKLASWPHEKIDLETCCETNGSLKRYYLSDNSGMRSSITFISSTTLSRPMRMDTSSLNTGGWAEYDLNRYLNTRVRDALPDKWKQLLKQVKVRSSIGGKSTEVSSSVCYIFVPSILEMVPSMSQEPYSSEGTHISHFTTNQSRICTNTNGIPVEYWTRSPNIDYSNYAYRIGADGDSYPVTSLTSTDVYARIMISM